MIPKADGALSRMSNASLEPDATIATSSAIPNLLGLGAVVLWAILAALTAPRDGHAPSQATAAEQPLSIHVVRGIVELRCAGCHALNPSVPGFSAPPGGVRLDATDALVKNAAKINASAVVTRSMPPGNSTGMTDEERTLLGRWVSAGAQAR